MWTDLDAWLDSRKICSIRWTVMTSLSFVLGCTCAILSWRNSFLSLRRDTISMIQRNTVCLRVSPMSQASDSVVSRAHARTRMRVNQSELCKPSFNVIGYNICSADDGWHPQDNSQSILKYLCFMEPYLPAKFEVTATVEFRFFNQITRWRTLSWCAGWDVGGQTGRSDQERARERPRSLGAAVGSTRIGGRRLSMTTGTLEARIRPAGVIVIQYLCWSSLKGKWTETDLFPTFASDDGQAVVYISCDGRLCGRRQLLWRREILKHETAATCWDFLRWLRRPILYSSASADIEVNAIVEKDWEASPDAHSDLPQTCRETLEGLHMTGMCKLLTQ